MDPLLNASPMERVHQDLVRGLARPKTGRRGLTAPRTVRSLTLMRVKSLDFRELAERVRDGYTLRLFTHFGARQVVGRARGRRGAGVADWAVSAGIEQTCDLAERVITQTQMPVFEEKRVPVEEKIVSTFAPRANVGETPAPLAISVGDDEETHRWKRPTW